MRGKARQIEKESKTDRESVHEKERKWLDGRKQLFPVLPFISCSACMHAGASHPPPSSSACLSACHTDT